MSEFESRREGGKPQEGQEESLGLPKINSLSHRDLGAEYVSSLRISAASADIVLELFNAINPEIGDVMRDEILPLVHESRLFEPEKLALKYEGEPVFWLQQERTLLVGGGGFRELGHKISVFEWEKADTMPIWDIFRCRRKLNAFDISVTMPNISAGSRWHLTERIGEAIGLGGVRELVMRAPAESVSNEGGLIQTRIAPGVSLLSNPPAGTDERIERAREELARLKSARGWSATAVELSEPLYGEMRGVVSALSDEQSSRLVDSGLLRFAERLAREGENINEHRVGAISKRMQQPVAVVFGRTMALGEVPPTGGPPPEGDSNGGLRSSDGGAEFDGIFVDSMTSVDIQGVRSPVGECTISFNSASQELFASALNDAPSFDEDKPVMLVRYPESVNGASADQLKKRAELTERICKEVDPSFSLNETVQRLESMGFNGGPAMETQYSRGKLKLTFGLE